jgi:hypothetical protein
VHRTTLALQRFIARLDDPDFIFILAVDSKSVHFRGSLEREWLSNPRVFYLDPLVNIEWGSFSQSFPPWMTVNALRKSNVSYDWISFHSGSDLVIRSRQIIKLFLQTYRNRAEFFDQIPNNWGRVDIFNRGGPGCASLVELDRIQDTVRLYYNQTAWNASARNFGSGSNWATISQNLANRVLQEVLDDIDFTIRISFCGNSDEIFLQTMANKIGLGHLGSCGMLRWLKFEYCHPFPLTPDRVKEARGTFSLFARKVIDERGALHKWIEEIIDQDDVAELPPLLRPRPGPCYRAEGIFHD